MMAKITPAAEAMGAPQTAITDNEWEMVEKVIEAINNGLKTDIKFHGLNMDFPGMPDHLTAVLTQLIEADNSGWQCRWDFWAHDTEVQGLRGKATIKQMGWTLYLRPSKEVYAKLNHLIAGRRPGPA